MSFLVPSAAFSPISFIPTAAFCVMSFARSIIWFRLLPLPPPERPLNIAPNFVPAPEPPECVLA